MIINKDYEEKRCKYLNKYCSDDGEEYEVIFCEQAGEYVTVLKEKGEEDLCLHMSENRKKAIEIMEIFEEFLEDKDITIPSDDREGNENEARIFGTEYYQLEDEITQYLDESDTI